MINNEILLFSLDVFIIIHIDVCHRLLSTIKLTLNHVKYYYYIQICKSTLKDGSLVICPRLLKFIFIQELINDLWSVIIVENMCQGRMSHHLPKAVEKLRIVTLNANMTEYPLTLFHLHCSSFLCDSVPYHDLEDVISIHIHISIHTLLAAFCSNSVWRLNRYFLFCFFYFVDWAYCIMC